MTNPFFQQPFDLPNHAIPFDKIETAHYMPAIEKGIEDARANIEDIKNNAEEASFANTIAALETASELLDIASTVFHNQLLVNGTDEMHALAEEIGPVNAAFSNDILLDPVLFARVKEVWDKRDELDLSAEEFTLLENTYLGFTRNGALLDEAGQARMREISGEMSVLGPSFMNNATKSAEAFEMVIDNENDLEGLPESAVEAAAHAAEERDMNGKWLFTLDIPSFLPFMQYSAKRELREKMWRAFSARGYGDDFDNRENILKIVNLRHERAHLLGFETHADYVLERRMAESKANVEDFMAKLVETYKPNAMKDLEEIKGFAKEQDGIDTLKPWDISYYAEKLKEHKFEFSGEMLRPYFPLSKVLDGMFNHFSKLFNLKFEETENEYPLWHEDVKVYNVTDQTSGDFVGTLYADFHPRKGKKSGAWMTTYRTQGLAHGEVMRPLVAIVCNFTKPTSSKPSLITHDEVTTLFHEMGHAVHALLSDVTYQSVASPAVKWDFVELPSQLQENWCYERETLDMIASHYETGEKIPSELIDKLTSVKNFMIAWMGLRQCSLGALDMAWYTTDPEKIDDVVAFELAAMAPFTFFDERGVTSTSFMHIFAGGYAAGYYSYKWAEVLEADTFEVFQEKGLYDRETAESYKNNILKKGGTEHPKILYERFRGREADPDALLRREGLL